MESVFYQSTNATSIPSLFIVGLKEFDYMVDVTVQVADMYGQYSEEQLHTQVYFMDVLD